MKNPTSAVDWLMSDPEEEIPAGPFAQGAPVYATKIHHGVIPLIKSDKLPAKAGITGRKGVQGTPEQYLKFLPRRGDCNIGLRLQGMVGIDVDDYQSGSETKTGAADLAELVKILGPLPCGPTTTARGEGPSRIHIFRLPEGFDIAEEFRGELSKSIDVIQRHHRLVVVWPSIHPKTGATYRWYNPDGSVMPEGDVPAPGDFPEIPAAWLAHLQKPQRDHTPGAGLGVEEFREEFTQESDPTLVPHILNKFDKREGNRHTSMLQALGWAAREAVVGKVNAGDVFDKLEGLWVEAKKEAGPDEFPKLLVRAVADAPEAPDFPDDLYVDPDTVPEDLGSWATDEFVSFLTNPEHAKAVESECDRRMVRRIADAKDASKRTVPLMTADEALDAILNGVQVSIPSVAKIKDHEHGRGLFYPGFINGIFGDQSVGKSVMLAEIQARTLTEGGTVVHWEYDNNIPLTIMQRLLHAGAKPEDIRGKFEILYGPADRDKLSPQFRASVTLVTLDALNPAATFFGVDPYHPTGIDTVLQECMTPFVLHGACGVFLDHVGHENKQRQTGSIRKSQAVQGALYEAVKVNSLKPGMTGRTSLILRKDNRGSLGMEDVTTSTAVMVSGAVLGGDAGKVVTVFEAPDPFNGETVEALETPEQRVIALLEAQGDKNIGRPRLRQLMEDKGITMADTALKVVLRDWKGVTP